MELGFGHTRLEAPTIKAQLQEDRKGEAGILSNGAYTKHSTDGDGACKHQQPEQRRGDKNPQRRPDRGLGPTVDAAPVPTTRQRTIAGIGKDDSRGGDGAALSDEELPDDVE